VTDDALRDSIRLFNRNRALIRRLYHLRNTQRLALSARDMQHVVKSSMVMDRADHTALLEGLVAEVESGVVPRASGMPVYLSGHLCQAPKLELLDMIEECGTMVVADDLYHGYRFIASDMAETGDPLDALADWYLTRNRKVPCPTRVDAHADWDAFLVDAVRATGADGIIVLLAKFCEPHMYHIPELKEAFDRAGISMLLIETEHDSMPLEAFKTRVETFVEISRRRLVAA
jgi:benzoyl-CoA reductase/2-hydroxyglutaryl-CoA dehydratase subunit BcrC/BadD/HgdB